MLQIEWNSVRRDEDKEVMVGEGIVTVGRPSFIISILQCRIRQIYRIWSMPMGYMVKDICKAVMVVICK